MAAPTYAPVVYADQTSGATGTPENSANGNVFVVSGTSLLNGTTPSVPSNSTTLTYGQQQCVIQNNHLGADNGTGVQFVTLAAGTVSLPTASQDYYIDLTTAGTLNTPSVPANAAPPAQADNTIRLWKVTTDATPKITNVVPWAP